MERTPTFIGQDDEYALFVVSSATTPGLSYEVWVKKEDWSVRCSCIGAKRWKKVGYIQHPDPSDCCWHERAVIDMVKRHLEE